jgi:hypothetical protein
MRLEVYFYAPDRQVFVDAVVDHGFAQIENGLLIPHSCARLSEIGRLVKQHQRRNEQGEIIVPEIAVEGYHCNVWIVGELEAAMLAGRPQRDVDGRPLGLFERSNILDMVPELQWVALSDDPVPPGYQGATGVRLFDPAFVLTPVRVWQ